MNCVLNKYVSFTIDMLLVLNLIEFPIDDTFIYCKGPENRI